MHCENCGSEIKAGNEFCESCGSKAPKVSENRKSFNFKLVLIGIISLFIIGGAFAYFGGFFNPKEDVTNTSKIRVEQPITSPTPLVQPKQEKTECNSDSNCADDQWCLSGKCSNLECPEGTIEVKNHDCITEIPAVGTSRCNNNVVQRVMVNEIGKFWSSGTFCSEDCPCGITEDGTAMCIIKHRCELDKIECLSESSYRKCEFAGCARGWINHTVPPKTGNAVYLCKDDKIILVENKD